MPYVSELTQIAKHPALVRLACFVAILLILWVPITVAVYVFWETSNVASVSVIVLIALYLEFVLLLRWWGRRVHNLPHPLDFHGLPMTRRNGLEALKGLAIGSLSLFSLFLVEGWLGWLNWQTTSLALLRVAVEGLFVALGVGLAEELLFRGWLIDELRWNQDAGIALGISSTVYAALHFIKPWAEILRTLPSFPGLLLLGLTLGWARQACQYRLGLAIGLHAGLVWGYYLIDVTDWIKYTDRVPMWVTGIDQNPLARLTGVCFLSLLAVTVCRVKWLTQ